MATTTTDQLAVVSRGGECGRGFAVGSPSQKRNGIVVVVHGRGGGGGGNGDGIAGVGRGPGPRSF